MACLVPQFKSAPDTHFASRAPPCHHHAHSHSRSRMILCVRAQCISTATIADIEKLQMSSFESHTASIAASRPFKYAGAIGLPLQTNPDTKRNAEALLANEEAVIAAVAAKAVALARAAVEVAKNAARMAGSTPCIRPANLEDSNHDYDALRHEMSRLLKMESCEARSTTEVRSDDEHVAEFSSLDTKDAMESEFELLQRNGFKDVAVRSGRQTDRKARRVLVAEKVAASAISMKSVSSKKKRPVSQQVGNSDSLGFIRGITRAYRLLTASEEIELSKGIQDLLKLERLKEELGKRYGSEPTFTQWAAAAGIEGKDLRKRLNHGHYCKDKMINSNIRLVISIARNYEPAGGDIQDLVQEGVKGLIRGAEKFDPSRGFKFSTYAHWWIRQAVRKSLSEHSRIIQLPFHMVDSAHRVKEAKHRLYRRDGRIPDKEEWAKAARVTPRRLQAVLLLPKPPKSLDQKIGIDKNMKLSDVIADPKAVSSERIVAKEFKKIELDGVLNALKPREKQVIKWRYGLQDGRMRTLQEIGDLMSISRERVRQIETLATRKLKNRKKLQSLLPFLPAEQKKTLNNNE